MGHVLPGRVWTYDHRLGHRHVPLSWRLERSRCLVLDWIGRTCVGVDRQCTRAHLLCDEGVLRLLHLCVGARHVTTLTRRPVDAVRVAHSYPSHTWKHPADRLDLSPCQQPGSAELGFPYCTCPGKLGWRGRFYLVGTSRYHVSNAACAGSRDSCATS